MLLLQAIPTNSHITNRAINGCHYTASINIAAFAFIKHAIGIFHSLLMLIFFEAKRTKIEIAVFIEAFLYALRTLFIYIT